MRRSAVPILAGLVLAVATLLAPQAMASEDADIKSMLAEIQTLAKEKESNDKVIKIALEKANETRRDSVQDAAKRQKLWAQKAANDAEAARLIGTYGGSVSGHVVNCNKKGKTNSACESWRVSLNRKIGAVRSGFKALEKKSKKRSQASKKIVGKRQRNREIVNRIAILRGKIATLRAARRAKAVKKGTNKCRGLATRDAVSQCMMNIWDKARSNRELPAVETVQKPAFRITPRRRTAQEAIAEYKGSGAGRRQLPARFRWRSLGEPPSPNLGK